MVTKKENKKKIKLKIYRRHGWSVIIGSIFFILIGLPVVFDSIKQENFLAFVIGVVLIIGGVSLFNAFGKEDSDIIKCERFEVIKE